MSMMRLWLKMMTRWGSSVMTATENNRTVYLPEDMLVEILSRVSEASLARFCSTSKGWNALIKKERKLDNKSLVIMLIDRSVYLARLDLQGIHDSNVVKVISQLSLNDRPLSTSSDIRHVFHWETSMMIKPLNSYSSKDTYPLGKSSSNKYKILRVHHHGHGYLEPCLVEYEIYDFKSNSWRVVGKTREWSIPRMCRGGTSVNGNTYWLTFTFRPNRQGQRIPYDVLIFQQRGLNLLTREEQKLCLLTSSRDEVYDIDISMGTKIKSTGDMSWSKLLIVERTHRYPFITLRTGMIFLVDRENKVIVHPSNSSNCFGRG
ncbi:hypothetical protein Bca52824_026452 [Brassica carinata]|uniref:F-box domain-containing protein n=1 Tax=Brassica carinata TaxID=52824 RepID=A0A8X7V8V6_BRACI|nr:hypothetical protein Bca52824_026452 [Brassica carinata]